MSLLPAHFLRRFLPLLLAALVLLAQSLALTHRIAHPNAAQSGKVTATVSVGGAVLNVLFGHANGIGCDDFDAALGVDLNPGQYAANVALVDVASAPFDAPAEFLVPTHPAGLFQARAPPQA